VEGLVEEAADCACALASPHVDEVIVCADGGEHIDGRGEELLLGGEEWLIVETDPGAEVELDKQLGAHVAKMLHGFVEPAFGESSAGRGGGEDDAVATSAGGLSAAGDQSFVDETVDRPVRERPVERPDSSYLAVGPEHVAEGPSVGDVLCDQGEADALGE
jgi:hypothetical protein